MENILVANAGSSSVKVQTFGVDGGGKLARKIKGQMDGIGTGPRLRASGPDGKSLIGRQPRCALRYSDRRGIDDCEPLATLLPQPAR